MTTVDEIINNLQEMVEKKIPIGPSYYLEQAEKLVALMGDETDKLYSLQREIAKMKVEWIEDGKSVAESKLRVEGNEVYEQMLKQKAKCERVQEIIRIAKIQARMRDNDFGSGNL